ncbi:MAG: hypothetical protein ACFFFK_13365 [Candidatus Thorarchaeota archaeon]
MGKDSTSNYLYILGIIGSIMIVVNSIIHLAISLEVTLLNRFLFAGGYILVGLAFIALYRDFDNYIPLLVTILWILMSFQPWVVLFALGNPNLVSMSMYLILFLLMGYCIYLFREPIGSFATLVGIIVLIWALVQFGIRYIVLMGGLDTLLQQIWLALWGVVFFFVLIYFYFALRS